MLREIGLTAAKQPEPRSCQQRFIDEYRRYLLRERGLAETSLLNYVPFAEQLLSNRFGQSDMDLSELTAADVTKFVSYTVTHLLRQCRRRAVRANENFRCVRSRRWG